VFSGLPAGIPAESDRNFETFFAVCQCTVTLIRLLEESAACRRYEDADDVEKGEMAAVTGKEIMATEISSMLCFR